MVSRRIVVSFANRCAGVPIVIAGQAAFDRPICGSYGFSS